MSPTLPTQLPGTVAMADMPDSTPATKNVTFDLSNDNKTELASPASALVSYSTTPSYSESASPPPSAISISSSLSSSDSSSSNSATDDAAVEPSDDMGVQPPPLFTMERHARVQTASAAAPSSSEANCNTPAELEQENNKENRTPKRETPSPPNGSIAVGRANMSQHLQAAGLNTNHTNNATNDGNGGIVVKEARMVASKVEPVSPDEMECNGMQPLKRKRGSSDSPMPRDPTVSDRPSKKNQSLQLVQAGRRNPSGYNPTPATNPAHVQRYNDRFHGADGNGGILGKQQVAKTTNVGELAELMGRYEHGVTAGLDKMKNMVDNIKNSHAGELSAAHRESKVLREQAKVLGATAASADEKVATASQATRIARASAKQWEAKYHERADTLAELTERTTAAEAARDLALAQLNPVQLKLEKLQEIGERVHAMVIARVMTMAECGKEFDGMGHAEKAGDAGRKAKERMTDTQSLLVFCWERLEGDYRLLTENGGFWRGSAAEEMQKDGEDGGDDGESVEEDDKDKENKTA